MKSSLYEADNLFPASTSIATEQQTAGNHYDGVTRHEQDNIIRNDKLLTDGNCQEKITYPDSSTFTFNQNVHDSLWQSTSSS